jgi:hypothetical protein
MAKRRFYSCIACDEITTRGYRVLTFAKCTTSLQSCLWLQMAWDPLEISWDNMGWYGVGMVLV